MSSQCEKRACFKCVLNQDHGANYEGHKLFNPNVTPTTTHPAVYDKAAAIESAKVPPEEKAKVEPSLRQAHTLRAFLMDLPNDDGTPRKPATLFFFMSGDQWKCCLHDRHNKRSAWADGPTWADAIEKMEAIFREGRVEWKGSW